MKKLGILLIGVLLFSMNTAWAETLHWQQQVEQVFGRKGAIQDGMLKLSFPRTDLRVKVGNIPVQTGLALGSWAAFKSMPGNSKVMAMGDLVVKDNEVAPVVSRIVADGLEISAIHNHLLGETPRIMYVHFSGMGNPVKLAEALKDVLKHTSTPLGTLPKNAASTVNWSPVESVIGLQGKKSGQMIQFSIPRAEKIEEDGIEIPPFMGTAITINLEKVGNKAATTGDFVLIANEVNPVIRALTQHGIAVTAVHSHMLKESPRLFYLHFWGYGQPQNLAEGLKSALDKTNSVRK